ncbi:MAG: methyltransferase domain-containing protein [Deltaproteobacteria bacterium]|nr:methyltransferase domain-containing protein [Deltaproteobacteria bacterium]
MKTLLLKIAILVFGRFAGLRENIIKALLLAEHKRRSEDALRWLLSISDFVSNEIDFHCIRWGNGIHIKHELMTGIHSFFYDRISEGERVLDVGCGIGVVAHAIVTHVDARVIGMDTNYDRINYACLHFQHPRLTFIHGDATAGLPEGRVDVIVFSSVIEHIDDRVGLLRKLIAVYGPKKMLIRAPMFERHYHAALKRKLDLFPYTDPDHKTEYTVESLTAELQAAGLTIRYIEVRWGDIWVEAAPAGSVR